MILPKNAKLVKEAPMSNTDGKITPIKTKVVQAGPYQFDDNMGHDTLLIDLEKVFGFLPRKIIVQKVPGQKNTITVNAVQGEPDSRIILPNGLRN